MAGITRVHGGVGEEGVINGVSGALLGASLKFFDVTVKDNGGTAIDLRPEMAPGVDGGKLGAVDYLMRVMPQGILAYYVPNADTGKVYLVVDGHAAFADTTGDALKPGLQEMIRSLVSVPALQAATVDVRGTTVALGTGFTVTP